MYDHNWTKVNVNSVPNIVIPPPGPASREIHGRASKLMKGYSSQVRLFPVSFESGHGVTLKDVDGNTYIDFSPAFTLPGWVTATPKSPRLCKKQPGR